MEDFYGINRKQTVFTTACSLKKQEEMTATPQSALNKSKIQALLKKNPRILNQTNLKKEREIISMNKRLRSSEDLEWSIELKNVEGRPRESSQSSWRRVNRPPTESFLPHLSDALGESIEEIDMKRCDCSCSSEASLGLPESTSTRDSWLQNQRTGLQKKAKFKVELDQSFTDTSHSPKMEELAGRCKIRSFSRFKNKFMKAKFGSRSKTSGQSNSF